MRKPRVIVCDDNDLIRDIFKTLLEKEGYEVLVADTPVTCAFYRDHADSCPQHSRCTDILITDYAMPGMTGLELLEIQHNNGCKLASRNKALMTGVDDPMLRQRTAELGCHFFPKPIHISVLLEWVKECEGRLDLSEPLAPDLFLPGKKTTICVDPT